MPRHVGDQDSQPVVLEPIKVVHVAPELIGGRVANRRLQDSARFRGTRHEGKLNLAGQIELEGQLLVSRLEQPVALGELGAKVGNPQMSPYPGVHLLHVVGTLRLLDIVIRARLQAGDLVFGLAQGGQHEDRYGVAVRGLS